MRCLLAVLILSAANCIAGEMPEPLDPAGFKEVLVRTGNLYIAGQPDEAALQRLAEVGVTTVINLRTAHEMDNRDLVPFDEAALVAALGMEYVHIPSGGAETPYSPAQLETFAAALERAEGLVLLHCTVAWRASHLWTAYLHTHRGLSLPEAVRHGRAINLGQLPLEGFLGQQLQFSRERP